MDYGALLIGVGAVLTAIGALVTGIYTGRNSRAKDDNAAEREMEHLQFENEKAVELATRSRIDDLAAEAASLRKRFREAEDEHDKRFTSMKHDRQKWQDAASYNFGIVSILFHLLANIFQVAEMSPEGSAQLLSIVNGAEDRMKTMRIPVSLDDTLKIMREVPET